MAKQNTVARVEEIATPIAKELGQTIWDVRFVKEGTDWYLRVFIDKEQGVSIDDCVDFSRALSKALDDSDPIPQSYMLEVASPGVERELVRDSHFEQFVGAAVMMRTIRPIDGVRDFNGIMTDYADKKITVQLQDGSCVTVDKKDTTYVKLDDFDINDFNKEF